MAQQGFDIRQMLRHLSGKRWGSKVLATTEHGTHRFEVIGVEGELGGDTVLRLRTIVPDHIIDGDGDKWHLQEDGRYRLNSDDPTDDFEQVETYESILRMYGVRPGL